MPSSSAESTHPSSAPAHGGSLAQTVLALAPGVTPSDVWRGAALMLLRVSAQEAEALAAAFDSPLAHDGTRRLVLDLFAGAGGTEAQATMRTLLASRTARKSSRVFADLVQRLGGIEMPDAVTLRFLGAIYIEARNQPEAVRAACAYALGACAGNARLAGDEDAAGRVTEALRRDLLDTELPSLRRALVLALGNAGLLVDLPAFVRAAMDPDASVRAAAAIAMRRVDDRTARAQLAALVLDPDTRVAESAIHALSVHRLDDAEVERIAEMVARGETPIALDALLLGLLVAQRRAPTSSWGRMPNRRAAGACPGALEDALRALLGRAAGSTHPSSTHASGMVPRGNALAMPSIPPPPPTFRGLPPSGRFASIVPEPSEHVDAMDATEAAPLTIRRPMTVEAKALLAATVEGDATIVRPPVSPEELSRRSSRR
jgi:hypothetical protein